MESPSECRSVVAKIVELCRQGRVRYPAFVSTASADWADIYTGVSRA